MECARHKGADAWRECPSCVRYFCDGCVRKVKAGSGHLEICPDCGGVLRVAAATVLTGNADLRDLLRRPFSQAGLTTALALAIPALLRDVVPVVGWIFAPVYLAGLASYYFLTIDHIGQGRKGLPTPSDRDFDWWETAMMAIRGLACILVGAAPFLIYASRCLAAGQPPSPPVIRGLIALGLCYAPAAITAVVVSNTTRAAFWPPAWLKVMGAAPALYARLVGLFFVAALAWVAGAWVAERLFGWLPIVGSLLVPAVSALLLIAQASLVGGFLRRNAEQFGYD